MANLPIGKYVAYDSWLHKLDPRVKIFGIICMMICVFLQMNTISMTFTMLGIMFVLVNLLLVFSHIPFRQFLKSFTSFWFMMLFLLLIYILIPRSNPVLPLAWGVNGWNVYWDSFTEAGKVLVRLLLMLELSMILTSTTKPLDLTYAFEWYLTPFKFIGLPTAEIAMTLSIALRFIPTLLEDADRVIKSQTSRGVDFEHGGLWKKIKGVTSLIIPLFVSSFLRSEDLANAMECRCYDPKAKRTRYRVLKLKISDVFAGILAIGVLAAYIYLRVSHFNFYTPFFEVVI